MFEPDADALGAIAMHQVNLASAFADAIAVPKWRVSRVLNCSSSLVRVLCRN